MVRRLGRYFALLIVIAVFAGCGGIKATKSTSTKNVNAPAWVDEGSGASKDDTGKVFYGVASASNIENASLLKAAADNRARNELAKVFGDFTASLMKDYAASTASDNQNRMSVGQQMEQAIKKAASMTLSGVEIADRWQHPVSGQLYSLARLDIESFKKNIDSIMELSEKAKEQIKKNAEAVYERMAQKTF